MNLPMPESELPTGRRERRRRELRERVLAVSLELVAEKGFDATTVEEIAAAADIAPATFFNHFQSKGGLLGEITAQVVESVEVLIEAHLQDDAHVASRLEGLARHAASLISEQQKLVRAVMLEMLRSSARPEDAAPYLVSLRRPLAQLLERGQANDEVRSDLEAEFLAEMVLGALHATLTQWLSDEAYPIVERLPRAASFISDAVRPIRATAHFPADCGEVS
jgi:AcrR family transcriptional regulator